MEGEFWTRDFGAEAVEDAGVGVVRLEEEAVDDAIDLAGRGADVGRAPPGAGDCAGFTVDTGEGFAAGRGDL